MADAFRDSSRVPALLARSSVNRATVEVYANPTTNALFVEVQDISAGTQTNDVKITLDSEEVIVAPSTGYNGAPVTVGTSIVEMTFTGITNSIMIQSDPDNTGKIWVGGSNITNTGANAVVQLEAGDAISVDINDASAVWYAISDTASQNVFKLATT